MGLVCGNCGVSKLAMEFSPSQRSKPSRVCKSCRVVRDAPKEEARRRGLRLCTICKIAKRSDYFQRDGDRLRSECKACTEAFQKSLRERKTHHVCSTCYEEKPKEEFTFYKGAKGKQTREHRCKECLAYRARQGRLTAHSLYGQAVGTAKRRGLRWDIPEEEYAALRARPCDYCGFPVSPMGVGLDRLDEHLGYLLGNVVPCCVECNLARGVMFTYSEMKILGAAIREVKLARPDGPPKRAKGWGRPLKYPETPVTPRTGSQG